MKPTVTLSRAMTDPALFGKTFQAPSFWTWRTLGKLIDGEPLTEPREIELFKQCTGRSRLPSRPGSRRLRRFIILAGRRAGKDRFHSAAAVWRAALCTDWRKHISAGEQAVVLLLGADKRQATILRRYCEGLLQVPLLAAEVQRRTDAVIEFRNGAVLEVATNDARLVRGRSAIGVFGSEASHWRTDEAAASSDEEVVAAAEPSMAMAPDGGLLMLGSSVHRKRGLMYRMFKKLHGNDDSEDFCWFAPSATMNPRLPPSVIEDALANDAPRARAEFLNIWREDVDDFVPMDIVEACTDWGVHERPRQAGIRYIAYADAAGGTGGDSFTLALGHAVNDAARSVVIDVVRERKPRFVAADVIREYAILLRSYGGTEIVSDGFAGGFCSDEWQRNGIRFKPCDRSTSENYIHALPMLTSRRARLVDHGVLRTQLSGLERRVLGGHEIIDHARASSAHDDVACAVAGVLALAATRPAPLKITAEVLRRAAIPDRRHAGSRYGNQMPCFFPGPDPRR